MRNEITQQQMAEAYQPLFDLVYNEYGKTLLKSEMDEILSAADTVNESLTKLFTEYCDVEGCEHEPCCGGGVWADHGYWRLCSDHYTAGRKNEPFPKMKKEALKRESMRGGDGMLPYDAPF